MNVGVVGGVQIATSQAQSQQLQQIQQLRVTQMLPGGTLLTQNAPSATSSSSNLSLVSQQQSIQQNAAVVATKFVEFTETTRGTEFLAFFKKFREREKYCDVILHVQGKEFFAHRAILAASSPYFDSIFQTRSIHAGSKSKVTPASTLSGAAKHWAKCNKYGLGICESLVISCPDHEVFHAFLNYMYTGQIQLDKNNVGELMRLANHFLMNKLKSYCAQYLERFIDCENCLQMKEVGEKFNVHSLAKAATTFVQTHLAEVINHEVMMDLSAKQVESFVTEKAWSIPQDVAVKFMSRWVYHDQSNRERDFKQLLLNMDWTTMDATVIEEFIDQEPLFGTSERSFFYVLHSLADKGIQVQKYHDIYQALLQRFGQESDQPLGLNDNLLQMAFNSAIEGLNPHPNSKWSNENDPTARKKKLKKLTLEQRRRKILAKIQRNRAIRKWVTVRLDKPRSWKLGENEIIADSSGDEECDPIQTDGSYRCHICPFFTKKVSRLEKHLASIHAHDVTYKCSECQFLCKWNREYFLHMKTHFDGPPYKCTACSFSCNKIGTLIAHKMIHVDLKPYSCPECEFKSRTKSNLAVHLKTHNTEKPYRCGICGRNFASKNSLDQHSVGHNTDKTYACTQCPFSTKYLNHFTNHKKSHQAQGKKGKELYKCTDPACKYATAKKSQLDSHMRSHAGVRPHVCGICSRRFLEKSHLVRHERIHFNERPFKCEECDYASTRRDKLKEHKTRHHGANASAKSPYKPRPHKSSKAAAASSTAVSASSSEGSQQQQQESASSTTSQSQTQQQQQRPSQIQPNTVYAKKTSAQLQPQHQHQPHHHQAQVQEISQQQQLVQQELGVAAVTSAPGGELEFILPNALTTDGSGTTFAQISGASALDLQQLANAGVVQLRQFPTTSQVAPVVVSTVSSSPLDVQFVSTCTSSLGTSRKSASGKRIILVQNKPGENIQVGPATIATIPTTMTAQDLQRTLGLKLDDLQGQSIIGIQQGGHARTLKLDDVASGNVQVAPQTVAQNVASGVRIQHQGTTIMLDSAQLQQIAQAAAASGASFERGIPITISTQGPTGTINAANITVNTQPQVTQGNRGGTGQSENQSDFSNIPNLFC